MPAWLSRVTDLSTETQALILAPTGDAVLIRPSWTRGLGSQVWRPSGLRATPQPMKGMALTIVETFTVTGGVDTHADAHVAAALNHIGGLLGVESFPTTAAGYARVWPGCKVSALSAWSEWRARAATVPG
jgi:hypothetical protein